MKIVYYCQHVLGVGHFFRTLEITRALAGHRIWFVHGGETMDVALPSHVQLVQLPPLMMDPQFSGWQNRHGDSAPKMDLEAVKAHRCKALQALLARVQPDCLITELFPFGRKAFRFELEPLLAAIKEGPLSDCLTVCSLRDILVEKEDVVRHETRVTKTLNRYYDAVLMHADQNLVRLEDTFSQTDRIRIPLVYTGFVAPSAVPDARRRMRKQMNLDPVQPFILVSGGGGKVAGPLFRAAVAAHAYLDPAARPVMQVFSGPYLAPSEFQKLAAQSHNRLRVARFTDDFLAYLAAADLSVSMAGYNTCMNLLVTGTPGLVWPFAQNREQGLRVQRLRRRAPIRMLTEEDLNPRRLAESIQAWLTNPPAAAGPGIDHGGARFTADWLQTHVAQKTHSK